LAAATCYAERVSNYFGCKGDGKKTVKNLCDAD